MALFSADSSLIYHLAPFVLNVITTSRPFILALVVFHKALFSALYSSSCTLPLSVLWSLSFPLTTTFIQKRLSFFSFHRPLNFDSSISHFQKPTCQNKQLFTRHLPLCSKSWFHLWWTSYHLWPNYISLQSLLLSYSSTLLYPTLPRFVNCLCNC